MMLVCVAVLCMHASKIPFDYLECESELVAGVIVDMSGVVFIGMVMEETNGMYMMSGLSYCSILSIMSVACVCGIVVGIGM